MLPGKLLAQPYSFFLDSADGNYVGSRYSFLGCDPFLVFTCSGDAITLTQNGHQEYFKQDPFLFLKKLMAGFRISSEGESLPFIGGAVGYFGYDMGRLIEKIPACSSDDITMPDCCLGFYCTVIAIDHHREKVWVIASGLPEKTPSAQSNKAQADMATLMALLASEDAGYTAAAQAQTDESPKELQADFDRQSYCKAIVTAKSYIAQGDIYQVNLSQRFSCAASVSPLALYLRLRAISPAPFACFFNAGDHCIISSSPERFLRISGKAVETRPIKGTRPRGATAAQDRKMRDELLASGKDRAELIMIVDLERNDLGRVCCYGSVHPAELITLETHPIVHHLVATIKGELAPACDHIDCLRACFPGGSITGAPKIRAMEIIEELEPCRRKIYTGSFGYLGFNEETDLNILIRTVLHVNGWYYFHVGGGIVADSDPDMEYDETLHKARGIMQALGISNPKS